MFDNVSMTKTDPVHIKLNEASWNTLLAAIADQLPDLYGLAYWLHVSEVVDLDEGQIAEWLRVLVAAGAV